MSMPKTLSCSQAGQVLAVSGIVLRRLAQEGKIKSHKTPDGNIQFDTNTIRQLAATSLDSIDLPESPVNQAMIISDDRSSSESLKDMLHQWEHIDIRCAEDAFDAGVLLNQFSPDVIIIDQKRRVESLSIIEKIKKNPDMSDCIGIVVVESLDAAKEDPSEKAHYMEKPLVNSDLALLLQLQPQRADDAPPEIEEEEEHSEAVNDFLEELYIPAPPDLFLRVRQAVPNLRKITSLVEEDPGLASKILQAVNSVAFGLPNKVASLPNAVTLLGLDYILNIINAVLIRKISKKVKSADLEVFWNISNEVGQYAAFLSRKLCIGTPDEAFTLGLFHNCGVPLIMEKYPAYLATLEKGYANQDGHVELAEIDKFKSAHSEVSYLTSRAWNLPAHITEVIRLHHNLDEIEQVLMASHQGQGEHESKVAEYLTLLKISEHFAELHLNLGKQNADYEWMRIKPAVLDYLSMDNDGFADLEDEVDSSYTSINVG